MLVEISLPTIVEKLLATCHLHLPSLQVACNEEHKLKVIVPILMRITILLLPIILILILIICRNFSCWSHAFMYKIDEKTESKQHSMVLSCQSYSSCFLMDLCTDSWKHSSIASNTVPDYGIFTGLTRCDIVKLQAFTVDLEWVICATVWALIGLQPKPIYNITCQIRDLRSWWYSVQSSS